MQTILITGATGTVGSAILEHFEPNAEQRLYRSTRDLDSATNDELYFDLNHLPDTIARLAQVDVLFLLRPPQIADEKIFKTLIRGAKEFDVRHIIFLSVQGAEDSSFVPHAKIERLIRESAIPYTFIRPSYFMQNLITQFGDDIRECDQLFVPAGESQISVDRCLGYRKSYCGGGCKMYGRIRTKLTPSPVRLASCSTFAR